MTAAYADVLPRPAHPDVRPQLATPLIPKLYFCSREHGEMK